MTYTPFLSAGIFFFSYDSKEVGKQYFSELRMTFAMMKKRMRSSGMDYDEGWCVISQYTSSTAQGGGGRCKNKKPIGEIGSCEAGMAERIH